MDLTLLREALIKVTAGFIIMAALLFVPAGTILWWNGWLLLGVLFIPMFVAGIVMLTKAPDLLRRRLEARENQGDQQLVIKLSGLMFIATFVVAGLGVRWNWPMLPRWESIIGAVVFLAGYALFGEVLRENEYLSRTVSVAEGQHVVDTGLYGIVRHPMYAATLLMFLAMPVILGSPFSSVIMLGYLPIINTRMDGEERLLSDELIGYTEYLQRVRWRVIPHLW